MSSLFFRTPKLQDHIEYLSSAVHVTPFSKHVLVYYVTGNPGLIEYYRNFLKFLTLNLSEDNGSAHQTQYHIHGESLAGFQLEHNTTAPDQPLSLDEIKSRLIDCIDRQAAEIIDAYDLKQERLPVVLIGHSIGTWLILETIAGSQQADASTSLSVRKPKQTTLHSAKVVSGILLFPTIVDLAKSPNGLRAGWALRSQMIVAILSIIARLLFFFVPLFILTACLQLLLSMPYHSALVTASFLKSKRGVRQALYMAHCELLQVDQDTWSDTLWGEQKLSLTAKEAKAIAKDSAASSNAKLFFYWGANDHWVANATRDELLSKRGRSDAAGTENRPIMEVDQHGSPHAFALHDEGARIVANKVSGWIRDVIQS